MTDERHSQPNRLKNLTGQSSGSGNIRLSEDGTPSAAQFLDSDDEGEDLDIEDGMAALRKHTPLARHPDSDPVPFSEEPTAGESSAAPSVRNV